VDSPRKEKDKLIWFPLFENGRNQSIIFSLLWGPLCGVWMEWNGIQQSKGSSQRQRNQQLFLQFSKTIQFHWLLLNEGRDCLILIGEWGGATNINNQSPSISSINLIDLMDWLEWLICWLFGLPPPGQQASIHQLCWLIAAAAAPLQASFIKLFHNLIHSAYGPGRTARQLFLLFISSPIRKSELEWKEESWMGCGS